MLVQDRPVPKYHQTPRVSQDKFLKLWAWISENFYRILTISLLLLTLLSVHLLVNASPHALCFQSQPKQPRIIPIPLIKWDSISPLPDTSSPFSTFRSQRWIVVSVSRHPSDSLANLVKIKGWQVLALGNSLTPPDWSLKGSIFLSLQHQSDLGFRITDHLPYDSYLRKNVGYLFAIQHGATLIYDADDRIRILDSNISKHFDVELGQDVILQYSRENPNRTVVNPYIHFGQRSVWPRGLPLENVGEIEHEEFYTVISSGKQFIQQGISNGLPDVDSVFYFTRKSSSEAFDIKFDDKASKVAVPKGLMVPLNSFNTIFHYSAFWGLMLPVSVSAMASDVLRGYWAQRILWEIDGNVVVYPPTVHRLDEVQLYQFSEEKDLHFNVGRLIKFLINWRSGNHGLFEKMLQLSYFMAKEGFWDWKDLEFTAAWLQDLVSVGYLQTRSMSVGFGRERSNIGEGDRKEFVPQKISSVHLGVGETETVNYEIGNLIRWRKNFGNVVLVMFCDGPVERMALEWRLLYGRIFKTVIILSHKKDEDLAIEEAELDHAYKYLPAIFNRYGSADGFIFLQDNTVLNYWNLLQADKNKLWTTDKVSKSWTTISIKGDSDSDWSSKQADMIKQVVNTMPVHFQVAYKESVTSDHSLSICNCEIFYVPKRCVSDFIDLVNLVGDLNIHHKAAMPMFFLSMNLPKNFDPILNLMVYEEKHIGNLSTFYNAKVPAIRPWNVSSEQDFITLIRVMATGDPLLMELF